MTALATALTCQASHAQAFLACHRATPLYTPQRHQPVLTRVEDHYLVSGTAVEEMFQKVTQDPFWETLKPPNSIRVIQSETINAFLQNATRIVITSSLLNNVRNSDELRYIMAHEMAHITLAHASPSSQHAEIEADTLAIHFMQRGGTDPCRPIRFLERISHKTPLYESAITERLHALQAKFGINCALASPLQRAFVVSSQSFSMN